MLLKVSDSQKPDQKLKILQILGSNIRSLQQNLPKNDNNLPVAYIDPQVILEYITKFPEDSIPDRVKENAIVEIDYIQQMPIINGLPFWERLDCEQLDYYKLFKLYRDQKQDHNRRSFDNLKKQTSIPEAYLHALSNIYHWQARTSAYDFYKTIQIEKLKEDEIKALESNHLKAAKKIFDYCVDYFDKLATTNEIAKMPPSQIIDWWEKAAKLGRLSLGMSADKPNTITNQNQTNIDKQLNIINNPNNPNPNTQNQTQMVNTDKKFLNEVLSILSTAGALPKQIKADNEVRQQTKTKTKEKGVDIIDANAV